MARTKLAVALALAGAIMSPSANALGLGAIEVKSALNQPLDARITLLPADLGELETLSVSLASAEAFQRAGVDRPFSLTRLKFTVVRGESPFVHVFTDQPVKEPFLDFLVEADWANGRLIREFTLLLDPPVFGGPKTVAPVVTAAPPSGVSSTPPAAAATAQAAAPAVSFAPVAATDALPPSAAAASGATYGPVSANDTLWRIAHKVRPSDSVSINQLMVALLRANPDAFIDGDMNRLKRGSVLQVPDVATVAAIDGAEANREAHAQIQRWRQARAVVAAEPRGRLRVVAPQEQDAEQADGASPEQASADRASLQRLERELVAFRESNFNLEAENEDLKAQIEGLKQDLARAERLLNLTAQQPVVGVDNDVAAPTEVAPTEAVQEPIVEEVKPAVAEEPVVPAAPKATPQAAPKPTPAITEFRQPSFFDDPRNLGLLGGAALALLSLIYLMIRRRRSASESAEALTPLPETTEEPEPAESWEIAKTVQPQPAEPEQEVSGIDDMPPDGDALSEADVYLAYGRYDQARELLNKALNSEPEHTDLRLKLLETLALMQDEEGFATHARLLHSQVGGRGASWQRALQMGREFLPADPLFADMAEPELADALPASNDLETALDLDIDSFGLDEPAPTSVAVAAEQAEHSPAPVEDTADDFTFDFDLSKSNADLDGAKLSETEFSVTESESLSADNLLEPTSVAASDESLEFNLGDLQFDQSVASDSNDNVLDFSRPTDTEESSQLDQLDEVGIKLNLARAYVDMGDSEGARSLIDEVLAEGSSHQRQEAEDLLQQIA